MIFDHLGLFHQYYLKQQHLFQTFIFQILNLQL